MPALYAAESGSLVLQKVVTTEVVSGVLDEIIGLLPVLLPVMIGFIAIRKGVSFVFSMLHSA